MVILKLLGGLQLLSPQVRSVDEFTGMCRAELLFSTSSGAANTIKQLAKLFACASPDCAPHHGQVNTTVHSEYPPLQ